MLGNKKESKKKKDKNKEMNEKLILFVIGFLFNKILIVD